MPRFLCVLLLASLLLNGCNRKPDHVVIGEYASLSGSKATFGKTTHNGIQLAIDEINAKGGVKGKPVELLSLDDGGDASTAGTVVSRLVNKDLVDVVVGEVASSLSLAAAPICQGGGVPMVSPSSTNPKVTEKGDMIFRVCFIDPFQGYVMAKFAREQLKADKVAIFFDQKNAYSVGLRDAFSKTFKELGGTITTVESYSEGDSDFKTQLRNLKQTEPQAVFVPGYYTEVANIALQAREIGLAVPLMGGDGWESPDLLKIAKGALEGCYYSNHMSFEDKSNKAAQEFLEAYKKKYGEEPGALAALGYDAARIVCAAIERAPTRDGKDIAAEIAKTKDFPGATGIITIDKDRNAVKPAVVLKIEGSREIYQTTIDPPK